MMYVLLLVLVCPFLVLTAAVDDPVSALEYEHVTGGLTYEERINKKAYAAAPNNADIPGIDFTFDILDLIKYFQERAEKIKNRKSLTRMVDNELRYNFPNATG